jgi:glycosyltransferase involved in cell wall biosynthesis
MPNSDVSYCIITPARNEERDLGKTIGSVVNQSIVPNTWMIVDDGSTDATGQIANEATRAHPWVRVVRRKDRGFRKSGGGVVEAFYDGYAQVASLAWDYLVKLDGDLSFERDYFEKCLSRFEADAKLGIGGGTICIEKDGELVGETRGDPPFHVRGATKIYRRACWEAIGGLLRQTGWDTLDEVKANMLGWRTRSFPELKLNHHRQTGKADGAWKNWFKNGRANYIVGYHPLFMLAKCVKRLFVKPYGVASVALWIGFASGYTARVPRVNDRDLIRYLRHQQMRAVLFRKSLWGEP